MPLFLYWLQSPALSCRKFVIAQPLNKLALLVEGVTQRFGWCIELHQQIYPLSGVTNLIPESPSSWDAVSFSIFSSSLYTVQCVVYFSAIQ